MCVKSRAFHTLRETAAAHVLSLSSSKERKAGVSILYGGPNRTDIEALRSGDRTGRVIVRDNLFLSRNGGGECDEQMRHHDGYINPTRDAQPTAARNPGHQGGPGLLYTRVPEWWFG